ncbi:MAG TPA: NADH-quinone oxidoreductase subunit NuoB [Bacillota bacterium]|nr:NADH-quinone oxidoreductase subunit NuoB [Bacillota bacterium]
MFKKMIINSMAKSPWLFHVNTGSCNGCDIELVACLTPRFDVERFGFKLAGSPRHADIVVVSGPVTSQSKERLIRILDQVPEPRVVVSLGSCPRSGNVFKGSYSVEAPLEDFVHVDVSIAGCAVRPQTVIDGLYQATQILKAKREAMYK